MERAARQATAQAARRNGIAARAARSDADFDSIDPALREQALEDFKATHDWTDTAEEDVVRKTVAYLLSRRGGRFGSESYNPNPVV